MKQLRIYCDTSVFGGCFDEEFTEESRRLFRDIESGKFILVISATVLAELDRAPQTVQEVLSSLPAERIELIEFSDEVAGLRDEYIRAGVVTQSSRSDAEHIASASVADVDFVVSWNFKHIVHYDKISGYQAVNLLNGYRQIKIYSPREVIENDEE
jgi:predicted nucleic acid-binding protein